MHCFVEGAVADEFVFVAEDAGGCYGDGEWGSRFADAGAEGGFVGMGPDFAVAKVLDGERRKR
jgi:hypothetical protein